eukprot:scaffold2119_cov146-Isochrysis_galbana.AAC.2
MLVVAARGATLMSPSMKISPATPPGASAVRSLHLQHVSKRPHDPQSRSGGGSGPTTETLVPESTGRRGGERFRGKRGIGRLSGRILRGGADRRVAPFAGPPINLKIPLSESKPVALKVVSYAKVCAYQAVARPALAIRHQ